MENVRVLPRLMTEAEVADYLGVHPETVARERRRKKLSSVQVGRKHLYREDHLATYLGTQCQTSTSNEALELMLKSGTSAGQTKLEDLSVNQRVREITAKRK
jgi:excisionase family DNA binding protein